MLVRGRFEPLVNATAIPVAGNAYQIRVPVDEALLRRVRREATAESWDDAVFLIDGKESEPAVGSGEGPGHVTVTAFVLG